MKRTEPSLPPTRMLMASILVAITLLLLQAAMPHHRHSALARPLTNPSLSTSVVISTLGNFVWDDRNGNGLKDPNEPGINGVEVKLYEDGLVGPPNGQIDAGEFVTSTITIDDLDAIGDDTSGANRAGFYQFEVDVDKTYLIDIPATNFDPGEVLDGYIYTGNNAIEPYSGPLPRLIAVPATPSDEIDIDFGFTLPNPSIDLIKRAGPALDGDIHTIAYSQTVTYSYKIHNTGNTHLVNIVITDDNATPGDSGDDLITDDSNCNDLIDPLPPGGFATCHEPILVDISGINIATAIATPTDADGFPLSLPDVQANDDAEVHVIHPALAVAKILNTIEPARVGDPISFTLQITNTGDVTITNLPLYDNYDPTYLTYIGGSEPESSASSGQIAWDDLTSFFGPLSPGSSISLDVFFDGIADTTANTDPECPNHPGETCNVAEVSGAMANDLLVPIDRGVAPVMILGLNVTSTLGDFVWDDLNGDGIKDPTELGIDGVLINLYEDGIGNPPDGVPQPSELISSTTTTSDVNNYGDDTGPNAGSGFYDFEVANNGVYIIEIDDSNFVPGGPLYGYEYSGDLSVQIYSGPEPRVTVISTLSDHNDADFAFTQPPIRIVGVDPDADEVTLKNFSTLIIDISNDRLCSLFNYTSVLSTTIVAGTGFVLSPGEEVTVATDFPLNNAGADLGLYLPDGQFSSADAMLDFVQWGSAGNGRESVADTKGIWTAGNFITEPGPFDYIGNGTENGLSFWLGTLDVPLDAMDDFAITEQNRVIDIDVLSNDGGIEPIVTLLISPTHGVASVNPNNTIHYEADGGYSGLDFLVYQVDDGGVIDSAEVEIVVDEPGNNIPNAQDDHVIVAHNGHKAIAVLTNDYDSDGDPLTVTVLRGPAHGSAHVEVDNTIHYTPTGSYSGPDTIVYQIDDGSGGVDHALVEIVVDAPGNNAPDAQDDVVTVLQNRSEIITVLGNDSDVDGDALSVTLLTAPQQGAASANSRGAIVYTPTLNYAGPDSLQYQVNDDNGGVDTAEVIITVDPPINNAPVAVDDWAATPQDQPRVVTVLDNDRDDDGDVLAVTITTPPTQGTAHVEPSGAIVYTPTVGYVGEDTLIYRLEDGNGTANSPSEDWATVTIRVHAPTNDLPVAQDDSTTVIQNQLTTIDVLENDYDVDGDPLTVNIISNPSNGTATVNPDGSIVYSPATDYTGTDTLSYQIDDGNGGTDTATVNIRVEPKLYNCTQITDISQQECEALVAIYRSDDGPDWQQETNWLENNQACTWHGVTCSPTALSSSARAAAATQTVTQLDLNGNQLNGDLPCEIGNLANLTVLNLSSNQLSGQLACEIKDLGQLTHLDLSHNQLTGQIPDTIGQMTSLQELRLNNNQLTGSIPDELGQLTDLQLLHLHENQLSGQVPTTFNNLTNLTDLNIGKNQLQGDIPSEVAQLAGLSTLDMVYNSLDAGDTGVETFLNTLLPTWKDTQTLAPTNLQVTAQTGPEFVLTWSPIAYTADGGFYEISYGQSPAGPFTVAGNTADKSSSTYTVSGLDYDTTYYFRVRTFTPSNANNGSDVWSGYSDVMPVSMATPAAAPTATATPDPTPTPIPAAYDLSVQTVEFTQAIQDSSNSVPLVAGKALVARMTVGVSGSGSDVSNVTAQLRAYRNGTELPNSPLVPFNGGGVMTAKLSPDHSQLNDTLNFTFPSEWLSAGDVTIEAEVNPGQTDQDNGNNNRTFNLTLHSVPDLEIVLVPIAFQPGGTGTIYRPTLDGTTGYGLGFIKDLYPVADIQYTIHSELLFTGDLYSISGWSDLLNQIKTLRNNELSDPNAVLPKYYGVIRVAPGCCLDQGFPVSPAAPIGGYANNPGGAGIGLEASEYQFSNGLSLVNVESHMAAHEIGHTLDLDHAPCNVSGDANFPQANGSIGDVGLYAPEMKLLASTYSDVMSYCIDTQSTPTMWISAYHYKKLFESISGLPATSSVTTQASSASVRAAALSTSAETGWLASGVIAGTGMTGTIQSSFTVTSTAVVSDSQACASHELRLVDDTGNVLYSYHFDPAPLHDEDGSSIGNPNDNSTSAGGSSAPSHSNQDYGYVLPKLDGTSRIQLWSGSTFLDECVVASAPPTLTASHVDTGTAIEITWNASDVNSTKAPWVLIRYSADGGATWTVLAPDEGPNGTLTIDKGQLAYSNNGLFEVIASNCTESTTEQIAVGAIDNTPPQPAILGADPRNFDEGTSIILEGEASDLEDGSIPAQQFGWSSPQGELGSGKTLILPSGLMSGTYDITLTVTDSQGTAAGAVTQVTINTLDSDGDSVLDSIEDAGPFNGDSNVDGTLDSAQSHIVSLPTHAALGQIYMTAEINGDCNDIEQIAHIMEGDTTASELGYDYPLGMVELTLRCANPGGSANVIYYWHTTTGQLGSSYRKYGALMPGGTVQGWYDYPASFGTVTLNGSIFPALTFTVTDGLLGDNTGLDGIIVDPGGSAITALEISKRLNTVEPVLPAQSLSFTIQITNTGNVTITNLPLTDTYNTSYLAFASVLGAMPAVDDNSNDGQLNWTNVLSGTNGLAVGESIQVVVNFTANAETTGIQEAPCTDSNATCTVASVESFVAHADVQIDPPPGKLTIGDFVWHDLNNNGTPDAGEPGLGGVVLNIYTDNDTSGTVNTGDTLAISTTTTITGSYIFTQAIPGLTYIVEIDASNFDPGGPLAGFIVTYPNTNPPFETQVVINIQSDNYGIDFGLYCPFNPVLEIEKVLNTAEPVRVNDPVSFTITITNTGDVTVTSLPLSDTYNRTFIAYDSIAGSTPLSVDNVDDGVIEWTDLVSGTAGLAPNEVLSVVVNFVANADTTTLNAASPCTQSGKTCNIARVEGAQADPDGPGAISPIAVPPVQDQDDVIIEAPTAVYLAKRIVSQAVNGVEVEWQTISETEIVGFYIRFGMETDATHRVNSKMREATYAGQSRGSEYKFEHLGSTLTNDILYILEVVLADGRSEWFSLQVNHGQVMDIFLPMVNR